jgi:hypothetical protein
MSLKIDAEKLPLKYELKVHRKTKNWPDAEGVLYEIARYLEFQDNTIIKKSKLMEIISNDEDKLEIILKTLIKKEFLEQIDESNYNLIKHGWE